MSDEVAEILAGADWLETDTAPPEFAEWVRSRREKREAQAAAGEVIQYDLDDILRSES